MSIRLEGVELALGGQPVLRGASLEVAAGEAAVLTGASGSGKSALLKLLLGLRPRAARLDLHGSIVVAGLDARRTPTPVLARRVGLLFQDAAVQLTQPDVASELAFRPENLDLAPSHADARVAEAARKFGLGHLLERPTHALSGGETKRVALAAVLAPQPEVLLLDEPLGGLDASWRDAVLRDIARDAAERTTLMVEHRSLGALLGLRAARWELREGRIAVPRPGSARAARERTPAHDGGPLLVEAEGLRARAGDHTLLDGVDLALPAGVTLLEGPNGSGKTTLLRALAGLQPFEGRARVAGLDPAEEPAHRMARLVGYVPQRAEDLFFAPSVAEEMAFGPRNVRGRTDPQALRGLAQALGLAQLLGRHPLTLSGGEQQRLALACALAHGPRVLLLDEPTVGLDAAGLARALAAVHGARQAAAVLVATHDTSLRLLADRVVRLERGRVVGRAAPRGLDLEAVA